MRLTTRTTEQIHSPIGEAFSLVGLRTNDRPLLNLSQAAPSFPTAPVIAARIAEVAAEPSGGFYAPQEGLAHVREAFADDLRAAYDATIDPSEILITAGCNQAFCLVTSALAEAGDDIMIPSPFYFNHDMWLRLDGLGVVHLPASDDHLPDVDEARSRLTDRTRAMVLVTPGNPTGVTIPPATLHAFADLAEERGIVLIVDETYRSYRGTDDPPHQLFKRDRWQDSIVSLHSFSKELAIPGYRVGAVVGSPTLLAEVMKLLDCVAICAPRIGQEAVAVGLREAGEWRRDVVDRIGRMQVLFEDALADKPGGYELVTAGAYFGWVRHPFDEPTADVVRRLVVKHDVLVIPGTAFTPTDERFLRFSFANLEEADIAELVNRLNES